MDNQTVFKKEIEPAITTEAPSWPPHEAEPLKEAPPLENELASTAPLSVADLSLSSPGTQTEPVVAATKNQLEKEIEGVLEEDIEQLFWGLSPSEQEAFKKRGEETATRIRFLLADTTVRLQEIFSLILEWLKGLPGVNSFFAEKEAKIKTDKILRFRQ